MTTERPLEPPELCDECGLRRCICGEDEYWDGVADSMRDDE